MSFITYTAKNNLAQEFRKENFERFKRRFIQQKHRKERKDALRVPFLSELVFIQQN